MDRLERFYRMQAMLQGRRFVRTQEFLDELEVSRATFKRDLEYLRDRLHAPIVYDREHEAYRFDDAVADRESWQLPGLWFNAGELQALLTMDRLLADLQPGLLTEQLAPIRRRLRSLLQSGTHSAEALARRIRILPMGARPVEPAHFRSLTTVANPSPSISGSRDGATVGRMWAFLTDLKARLMLRHDSSPPPTRKRSLIFIRTARQRT